MKKFLILFSILISTSAFAQTNMGYDKFLTQESAPEKQKHNILEEIIKRTSGSTAKPSINFNKSDNTIQNEPEEHINNTDTQTSSIYVNSNMNNQNQDNITANYTDETETNVNEPEKEIYQTNFSHNTLKNASASNHSSYNYSEFSFSAGPMWRNGLKLAEYHYKFRTDPAINLDFSYKNSEYITYKLFFHYVGGKTEKISILSDNYYMRFDIYTLGAAIYAHKSFSGFEPYAGFGLGYAFDSIKTKNVTMNTTKTSKGSNFSYILDAGVKQSFFNNTISAGLGLKHIGLSRSVKNANNITLSGNMFYISAGYRF